MAAGAPLIPEGALGIAAIADLLLALLDLIALGVLLGLLWTYKNTLGAVIEFLVKHTTIHTPFGSFSLLFPLEVANNNILAGMGTAALGLEVAGGRFFHAFGVIIGWMVNMALYTATTVEQGFDWFKHVHIPRALRGALLGLPGPASLAALIAYEIKKALTKDHKATHAATQQNAHAAQGAQTQARAAGNTAVKSAHAAHAITSPKEVAKASTLVGTLAPGIPINFPRDYSNVKKRLKSAEKWIAAGALAAAMANVLGVSARCLRSGNIGKAARRICGLDSTLLNALLAGLLIVETPISIEELAHEYLSIMDEVVGIVTGAVSEVKDIAA